MLGFVVTLANPQQMVAFVIMFPKPFERSMKPFILLSVRSYSFNGYAFVYVFPLRAYDYWLLSYIAIGLNTSLDAKMNTLATNKARGIVLF